ncbi:NADH:flavin oxidoreductase/NADH oxidase [Cystobacter fuscus DSM 2262]|uniref:NADH:flavin oxidoreductase/NADH oxidase n=1 Tax=Cystobacter fuscus (strain ATCC 25194 / DSM 2262 / NBRC 100088 / M29) TaxID=1242864 RepID=S9PEC6_CYSF2|nr:NADH:flavin oxidoreductase/NADH oxidase [Cystobacter fuscus]EPX60682.1 NADH:flavin oxidoreductase/NADH oxidase [Cystobacter fuscus DSM 2262]
MSSLKLFEPITLRGVRARNRLVVSPMCQYSAVDGIATDYHLAHLGRFALGGFGIVFVEATGVSPEGRITHGDMGLWNDAQIAPLARISTFLRAHGAVPAIQLGHAGRKGSRQRPWEGDVSLTQADADARGEGPWPTVAPSALPHAEGWQVPGALTDEGLERLRQAWRSAAQRALQAGFDIVEVHCAHGYLLNEFLSPVANRRTDRYGGTRDNRMRFPLEVIEGVRAIWPQDKPVFVRVSSIDGVEGGWTLEDTVAFARELEKRGVDVLDCSSGGVAKEFKGPSGPGYQVGFAQRVREETGLRTIAVGLITEAAQAEAIVAEGRADLVALAREALAAPQWPLNARRALEANPLDFQDWPIQSGHWLANREKTRRMLKST